MEKRITSAGQERLSNLDERTIILFKTIIADVCKKIATDQKLMTGFFMLSMNVGDMRTHGRFIKETALPYVEELVQELDDADGTLLDEAVSEGVAAEDQRVLDLCKIQFDEIRARL